VSGVVIRTFAFAPTVPTGLTYDGRSLWACSDQTNFIYQVSPVSGTLIQGVAAPGISLAGLAWDGRTLWHSDNDTDLIYQISVT
jgi:hypothetical protein